MTSHDPSFILLILAEAASAVVVGVLTAEWAANPENFFLFEWFKKRR